MAQKLLLIVFIATMIAPGCKKNNAPSPQSQVTGTWKQIKQVLQVSSGASASFDEANTSCIVNKKLTINADGTFTLSYTGAAACYEYVNGNNIGTIGAPGDTDVTGTWSASGQGFSLLSQGVSADMQLTGSGSNALLTLTSYYPALQETFTATFSK